MKSEINSNKINDFVIANCKLVGKEGEWDIATNNGKIAKISKQALFSETSYNAKGNYVLPGLIDVHVHFRDPGLTYKEDFKSGSQAACNGGFTTILDMPNTKPSTNSYKTFKEKMQIGKSKSIIDFGLHTGTGEISEFEKISRLKPASFKIFMDLLDTNEIEAIFSSVENLNKDTGSNHILTLHCEEKSIVESETRQLKSEGKEDPFVYSLARPPIAEIESVKKGIELATKYNVEVHFCHISTKESLYLIKNNHPSFTCEITPQHLLLNSEAFNKYGNVTKTNPPLRPEPNNISINELGSIDMIGTDHAPHTIEEKEKGVWEASPGIPNLEIVLPVLLTKVNNGSISLATIERLLAYNPAKRFNMHQKGEIDIGKDADFVVIDLKKEGKLNCEDFYTKAHYTPFDKYEYTGNCIATIHQGHIVMENNEVYKNKGRYIYENGIDINTDIEL
ncbi:MAG: dihydroorotase [Methanobacteriaceae archaeon]